MKVLTSKIVNGKKMFLIEDNNPQGKVFAPGGKFIKKENISNYNPYYVDIKGLNASESTKNSLTPATKITPQEIKKIKESPTNVGNIKIKEAQEKAQRLKEAEEAYKKRKAGVPITPELLAQETQAIGDKISLQNIPGVGQYIPDMLDVTGGIGSMASGLGAIPLNLNRGNYGQALLSVASPLAAGALAGVGSPTVGQFVNNVANPLAGTGDLINNLGNKYLPNAYKLNPFAFKPNPEMMYRGIGKEGMEDALESGVFRAKQNVEPSMYNGFDMSKQFNGTYYTPKFETANQYGKGFIAEVPKDVTSFRLRYKGKGNKTWSQIADENIPINKGRILEKDWLKGYKQIDVPKQQFKSEIDWGKWNKEIPENKALMQEYNAIEQQAKANGTWMKNPDGSTFQGTPEQFVQQNSENFKKAFPEGYEKVYRGDMVGDRLNTGDIGNNKSIFTGDIETGKHYAGSKGSLFDLIHPKSKNSIDFDNYGRSWRNISRSHFGENPPELDVLSERLNTPQKGNYTSTDDIAKWIEKNNKDYVNIRNIFDGTDANFVKIVNHKPGNYLKSAIGNNGMFDMTNPNIYKTLIPGAMTLGALNQTNEKQFGGTIKILNTKIENGKKYFLINE